MIPRAKDKPPLVALGLASAVLGSFGCVLCFLPILGISFASWGLTIGIAGLVRGIRSPQLDLRWALVGTFLCATAIGIGLTLAYTPVSQSRVYQYEAAIGVPVGTPYISPPARPGR